MTQLLDQVRHIEQLNLHAKLSYFNLDYLFNLKMLSLVGSILKENFNYGIFKNLSKQLEVINIFLRNIDEKKLFDGYRFSNLQSLIIRNNNIIK